MGKSEKMFQKCEKRNTMTKINENEGWDDREDQIITAYAMTAIINWENKGVSSERISREGESDSRNSGSSKEENEKVVGRGKI